ncbi:unnamed protein product, partial [Allacma fusca]
MCLCIHYFNFLHSAT